MRRLASLLLPVLTLSACYGPYAGSRYDSRYAHDRWSDVDGPLDARLTRSGSRVGIELNSPAYVAVFQILPGRGVGLMYPAWGGEQQLFSSGFSLLPPHGPRWYDSYSSVYSARYLYGEPAFYFLVASRSPLRSITRFQRSDGALRSVLGVSSVSTLDYRRVMDDLVYAVVPPQPDDDWTTDVLAVWPQDERYAYSDDYYTRVYCNYDNVSGYYPLELAQWACLDRLPRTGIVRRIPDTGNPPPRQPGDTTHVNVPARRRPEPPTTPPAGTTDAGRWTVQRRRTEPVVDAPRDQPSGGGRRVAPPGGGEQQPADQPQVERSQPREVPRSRPHETAETPRVETRSEPRETPRSEPVHRDPPPRSEPVRNDPPPSPPPPAPRVEAPRDSRPAPPPAR